MKRIHRNLFFIALSAGIISFTSCKENKENATEASHEEMEMSQDASSEKMTSKVEFKDEKVATIYADYLELKDALVATDADAAKKAAQKLAKTESPEIVDLATKISEETAIAAQRKDFSELTTSVEAMLQNEIASGKIYKQFCPMAFDGKGGFWLSNSEDINNPYFGDKMLHCGRIEKTIK